MRALAPLALLWACGGPRREPAAQRPVEPPPAPALALQPTRLVVVNNVQYAVLDEYLWATLADEACAAGPPRLEDLAVLELGAGGAPWRLGGAPLLAAGAELGAALSRAQQDDAVARALGCGPPSPTRLLVVADLATPNAALLRALAAAGGAGLVGVDVLVRAGPEAPGPDAAPAWSPGAAPAGVATAGPTGLRLSPPAGAGEATVIACGPSICAAGGHDWAAVGPWAAARAAAGDQGLLIAPAGARPVGELLRLIDAAAPHLRLAGWATLAEIEPTGPALLAARSGEAVGAHDPSLAALAGARGTPEAPTLSPGAPLTVLRSELPAFAP